MKKFLELLQKTQETSYDVPTDTDAERRFKIMKDRYLHLKGHRALYVNIISKSNRELKVVTITNATDHCVEASYNYYGNNYHGKTQVSIRFSSLLCGEERLEIE